MLMKFAKSPDIKSLGGPPDEELKAGGLVDLFSIALAGRREKKTEIHQCYVHFLIFNQATLQMQSHELNSPVQCLPVIKTES